MEGRFLGPQFAELASETDGLASWPKKCKRLLGRKMAERKAVVGGLFRALAVGPAKVRREPSARQGDGRAPHER
jgi:hypothetical protein